MPVANPNIAPQLAMDRISRAGSIPAIPRGTTALRPLSAGPAPVITPMNGPVQLPHSPTLEAAGTAAKFLAPVVVPVVSIIAGVAVIKKIGQKIWQKLWS